jgi:hypothetical protein
MNTSSTTRYRRRQATARGPDMVFARDVASGVSRSGAGPDYTSSWGDGSYINARDAECICGNGRRR